MNRILTAAAVAALCLGVSTGVQAKTLKMAYDADPVSLDPHEQLSGGTLQLSHMTFDPLVRWTKDLGFAPRLAESRERVAYESQPVLTLHSITLEEGIE